ncbi:TM2 domain-containing protein [Chryseobacterium bernardetii]|uniref:TM2 domain-containing protein n=1 Tax=Chryseobacterium bernardetii TaxID=1241978 RepID=UPI001625B15D|nr:TM2 domain-containing protein [Chryseobacterium bernardetii]
MGNFSYLIQKKFRGLNSEQQKIFISEFERRKKSVGISYLLWFLLGWHYAYLKKWGWLILYILTVGGFFIWAIIDLFRIPKIVEQYNNDLALEILWDISIMFPDEVRDSVDKDVNKKAVNDLYITQKIQSGESYSFYIIIGIIILFSVSAFFLKPNNTEMKNKIVDDIMTYQPQLFKNIKDFFAGEKLNEMQSQSFITLFLLENGYENSKVYDEDLVLLRKLVYKDENDKQNLITAYGFLGFTKIIYECENLEDRKFRSYKNERKTKPYEYSVIESPNRYQKFESPDSEENEAQSERREKNKVSQHSKAETNAPNQQGDSIQIN